MFFICSIIQHVTGETTMKEGVDLSVQPDKSLTDMEKDLLEKFQVSVSRDKYNREIIVVTCSCGKGDELIGGLLHFQSTGAQ